MLSGLTMYATCATPMYPGIAYIPKYALLMRELSLDPPVEMWMILFMVAIIQIAKNNEENPHNQRNFALLPAWIYSILA
jgi:hypothetical protein